MRGTKFFGRGLLGAFCIVMLSMALVGCSLIREAQFVGMTGGGSADTATSSSNIESGQETAVFADADPSEAKQEAGTAVHPSEQGGGKLLPPPSKPKNDTNEKKDTKSRPRVALTFDDGPDHKYTEQILDILKEYDVKATFFLVGTQVKKYPEIAKRIVDEGHALGNHSWSHADLTKLSAKDLAQQIDKTQQIIKQATGVSPRLMRAPYGALSKSVLETIHKADMKHVAWTVDTKDWAGTSVSDMYKNVMSNTRKDGIILMHSFGGRKDALDHTVKLLPKIIKDLQKDGYDLVTVDEMIDSGDYKTSAIK